MSYLHGISLCCAQGERLPEKPQPPARVGFDFLGQHIDAPFYRAFPGDYLNRAELAALVHRHIQAAVAAAGWPEDWAADGAVFIGSTSHAMAEHERRWQAGRMGTTRSSLHEIAAELMARHGYAQPYCFATSCTSAAHALLQAHRLLHGGVLARAVVVGVEAFNLMSLMHFHSVGLLGDDYRPFAADGFILGEGVAALALSLESKPSGSLCLQAAAVDTDVGGLTETGSAALEAVTRAALQQAQVSPAEVRLVKAHAVGSAHSDAAEQSALAAVFGDAVPLAGFKMLTGHTLGASAAIETALLYQALQAGVLPAGARLPTADGSVPNTDLPLADGAYITQFSGFGGSNLSMVWQWQS
ncbi:3-oxoacyl-(acyl-carrier-protein) synthase [Neisseria sp. HSC-16F19]|nr:beta-ketoacyl synthase N-terminal-like domain-containing protein [Neisseria sp. HSC-16F19]MCP2041224.1 3-oxoacyl-(acyl-carrier-protein) synthase [Neisseria sp. HSC-16F19]